MMKPTQPVWPEDQSSNNVPPTAPVIIFAYERPIHLQLALAALTKCHQAHRADVTVYIDMSNPRTVAELKRLFHYTEHTTPFNSFKTVFRAKPYGLAQNIQSGISKTLQHNDSCVVIEDDVVVAPDFLIYMWRMLHLYKDDLNVASISGYVPRGVTTDNVTKHFFLRGPSTWGWATWARVWKPFMADAANSPRTLQVQLSSTSLALDYGLIPFYYRVLWDRIRKINNSWGICWYVYCVLQRKYTAYPAVSLVKNIGNDESGQHTHRNSAWDVTLADSFDTEMLFRHTTPEELPRNTKQMARFVRRLFLKGLWRRLTYDQTQRN